MVSIRGEARSEKALVNMVFDQKCHVRTGSCGSASTADSEGSEHSPEMVGETMCHKITYPLPVQVRNTFIDVLVDRPPSLESYMQIRQTQSAPASDVTFATERAYVDHGYDNDQCIAPLSFPAGKPAPEGRTGQLLKPVNLSGEGEVHVKNTFINCAEARAPSLEGFYEERRVRSCPGSGISQPFGSPVFPSRGISVVTADSDEEALMSAMAAVSLGNPLIAALHGSSHASRPTSLQLNFVPDAHSTVVLNLTDALVEPEVGSLQCPSVGSKGHNSGLCKPCAFTVKGCSSGKDCSFCHLCDVGEKKRRRKDKKDTTREVTRWKKSMADSWRHMSGVW